MQVDGAQKSAVTTRDERRNTVCIIHGESVKWTHELKVSGCSPVLILGGGGGGVDEAELGTEN